MDEDLPRIIIQTPSSCRSSQDIKKLEIHYTPKHGSWLDIAEIDLNFMTRQCLSRWISNIDLLMKELSVWEDERNSNKATVNWQFKTSDARIKLKSLYPIL